MQLENSDLLNLVLQISTSNRNFIQLLLNHGCISYSQLCSDILKVLLECYPITVERKSCTTFNSFITYYLQFVFCENKSYSNLKQAVNIFNIQKFFQTMSREFTQRTPYKIMYSSASVPELNFINYIDRLKKFKNHNSLDIDFDHLRLIQNSKLFDFCANVKEIDNENSLILRNQIARCKQIFAVEDFQTFLSPLKEDYTKSSKGYIFQNKIEVNKNKLTSIIDSLSDDDDLINMSDESEIDGLSFTDENNYDPIYDGIISRYLDSLINLPNDCETNLHERVSISDSDDSITFSYYIDKCVYGYENKPVGSDIAQFCDIFSSDSENEECEMYENNSGSKFFKVTHSNLTNLSEENNFDLNETFDSDSLEICDTNSSPEYQSLEGSLITDFSSMTNSLSQSPYFDGFVNPCFEDDEDVIIENVLLKNVNDEWERNMQNISCEPREPKKVSFLPMPDLVAVRTFEPDNDDGYSFGIYLLNQIRFKNRIEEFEQIIRPYLSAKHRASIYKNYFGSN